VADVLGLELEEDVAILQHIEARFLRRKLTMPAINRRQAMVPRGAIPLENPNGTAPGLFIEQSGRLVALLPGPPRELQPMFDLEVAPRLKSHGTPGRLLRRVIKTTGRSESQIEELAFPIYSKLSDDRH